MSDYPMLISNKLHSFRNFYSAKLLIYFQLSAIVNVIIITFVKYKVSINYSNIYI